MSNGEMVRWSNPSQNEITEPFVRSGFSDIQPNGL